ncbi:hypothetical protein Gpo141_00011362 [Globisporangium polare]
MRASRLVQCVAACATLAHAQPDVDSADLVGDHEMFTPEPDRVFMLFDSAELESEHDVFTPEPERVFQSFHSAGWTNAYTPNVPATCSGAVAGFADKPLADSDCLEPFQFLLERGTDKVRHGCFKCAGAFQATPTAAPYATCDGRPICSGFSLAYYRCFLKNDTTSDMFACLMGVNFQADR